MVWDSPRSKAGQEGEFASVGAAWCVCRAGTEQRRAEPLRSPCHPLACGRDSRRVGLARPREHCLQCLTGAEEAKRELGEIPQESLHYSGKVVLALQGVAVIFSWRIKGEALGL